MYKPYEWKLDVKKLQTIEPGMSFAVMYSGGKDSGLAVSLTIKQGKLNSLLHCVDPDKCNSMFHNQSVNIINEHSKKLGVPVHYMNENWWQKWDHLVAKYIDLKRTGVRAVVFGDIGSEENIEMQYKLCVSAGLRPCFPLYKRSYDELIYELEKRRIRSIITCINNKAIDPKWLGCIFDKTAYHAFQKLGIDAFGEYGEFHTTLIEADYLV